MKRFLYCLMCIGLLAPIALSTVTMRCRFVACPGKTIRVNTMDGYPVTEVRVAIALPGGASAIVVNYVGDTSTTSIRLWDNTTVVLGGGLTWQDVNSCSDITCVVRP